MVYKKKGISVLICSLNGGKVLATTLSYLAKQSATDKIKWELIFVDNGSTDGSQSIVRDQWMRLGSVAPLSIYNEPRRGKDHAIDLGFEKAKYSYVVMCDDDNWLVDNYLEVAYRVMTSNHDIGLLGGKGVPAFEAKPPSWFETYKSFYAVGEQYLINGEIKHFWPYYRFIWGAGSVVNMRAYFFLKKNGFKRILNSDENPRVARSEDVELGLAMWLAGYKLWNDNRLIYHHFLTVERLKWQSFMKMLKPSISSMHYLRPYNILIFTGYRNKPKGSFWKEYIFSEWRSIRKEFSTFHDIKLLLLILLEKHVESPDYFTKAKSWYRFTSAIRLGKGYDEIFNKIVRLQSNIMNTQKETDYEDTHSY